MDMMAHKRYSAGTCEMSCVIEGAGIHKSRAVILVAYQRELCHAGHCDNRARIEMLHMQEYGQSRRRAPALLPERALYHRRFTFAGRGYFGASPRRRRETQKNSLI